MQHGDKEYTYHCTKLIFDTVLVFTIEVDSWILIKAKTFDAGG